MNYYDSRVRQRIKDQQNELEKERARRKRKSPNERMEEDAPERLGRYDFWCDNCQEDFEAPCYKTRHRIYGDTIAVWRASCPECGDPAVRHITHRDEDQYYEKSQKIRVQRNRYAWETLQAGQFGFKTHYGNPNKKGEENLEARARRIIGMERKQGFKGMSQEARQKLKTLK